MASDLSMSSPDVPIDMYPDSPPLSLDGSMIDLSSATSPLTTPDISEIDDPPPSIFFNGQTSSILSTQADSPSYILVIGGLGYIGSHTVLELLREGYNGMKILMLPWIGFHSLLTTSSNRRRQSQQLI